MKSIEVVFLIAGICGGFALLGLGTLIWLGVYEKLKEMRRGKR